MIGITQLFSLSDDFLDVRDMLEAVAHKRLGPGHRYEIVYDPVHESHAYGHIKAMSVMFGDDMDDRHIFDEMDAGRHCKYEATRGCYEVVRGVTSEGFEPLHDEDEMMRRFRLRQNHVAELYRVLIDRNEEEMTHG
jgi:hypothetical protein